MHQSQYCWDIYPNWSVNSLRFQPFIENTHAEDSQSFCRQMALWGLGYQLALVSRMTSWSSKGIRGMERRPGRAAPSGRQRFTRSLTTILSRWWDYRWTLFTSLCFYFLTICFAERTYFQCNQRNSNPVAISMTFCFLHFCIIWIFYKEAVFVLIIKNKGRQVGRKDMSGG